MANKRFNLLDRQRAERKLLLTVVEWTEGNSIVRELVGTRIAESEISYNPDVEVVTNIIGITKSFVRNTKPQQDLDYPILGSSKLGAKLNDIRRRNATSELKHFTVYIITAFVLTAYGYETEKHSNCTIVYNSLGGADRVEFPITIYFSNNIDNGVVNKLSENFTFTSYSELPGDYDVEVEFVNENLVIRLDDRTPLNFELTNDNLVITEDSTAPIDFTMDNDNLIMLVKES